MLISRHKGEHEELLPGLPCNMSNKRFLGHYLTYFLGPGQVGILLAKGMV